MRINHGNQYYLVRRHRGYRSRLIGSFDHDSMMDILSMDGTPRQYIAYAKFLRTHYRYFIASGYTPERLIQHKWHRWMMQYFAGPAAPLVNRCFDHIEIEV